MIAIIIFIIILSVLVMIHELGHFIMAKRAGIGVEEFGFGLPPRLWGKKVGETIYSVNWLPFGGFVRLKGEDPTDKHKGDKNSFWVKSAGQRAKVILAGVFMNFVLAVVIFYVAVVALGFKVNMPLIIDHDFKFVKESRQVLVTDVGADTPAQGSGIEAGDSILSVDGVLIADLDQLQKIVRASQDKQLTLVLENSVTNNRRTVVAVPAYNEKLSAPALGVGLSELISLNFETPAQKIFSGFIHSYNTMDYSLRVMAELVSYSVRERDISAVSEGVAGPVGIAAATGQAVAYGPIAVLQLAGLLSLNLAFLNVLPIPALDGGRFFFLVVEVITRRRTHPVLEKWVHTIGFAVLIGLVLLITYNDILKLVR